jgi:hypothetical protein
MVAALLLQQELDAYSRRLRSAHETEVLKTKPSTSGADAPQLPPDSCQKEPAPVQL